MMTDEKAFARHRIEADQAKDEEIARLEALVESAFLEGFANYAPAGSAHSAWEESDARYELKGGK